MMVSALLLLTACSLLAAPSSALYYKDVTSSDFDKLIDPSKAHILLELYAPWCGHCKNLAPEFEKLGETFASTSDVIIAQVDADKHKKLGTRFSVKGFPTLKWIPKGSSTKAAEDVNAGRTAADLLAYVNQKTGLSKKLKGDAPSSVTALTKENFAEIALSKTSRALVEFFAPWCGHCKQLKPIWESLANVYADEEDVVVAAVDCDANADLCSEYSVEGFPTLKYFHKDTPDDYSGGRSLDDLVSFLNSKTGHDLAADGGVIESAGVIHELTSHVDNFLGAENDDQRVDAVNVCKKELEGAQDETKNRYFAYYLKVFDRITKQGAEYIKNERDRLSKVLESSEGMKPAQKRNFMRRINVLNAFYREK